MSERSVGLIGAGRMGGRLSRRLLDAGFALTVFDTNESAVRELTERGARAASLPADVASECEIVIACLPAPRIVETVALGSRGVIEGTRVKIFVDMSTTGATSARRVAEGLARKGIVAVDAPMSGGIAGAEKGTLAIMVSCADDVLTRITPILEVFGKIFHVGREPGLGQTMKLLNNLLSATAMAISSEAVVMGVKAGLDPRQIVDVINAGTGRNSATADKIPRCVIPRTFNTGFSLELLNKDVRLCLEEGEALGIPMIVGKAVRELLAGTIAAEGAEADMTEIIKPLERAAGVQVK